MLDGSTAPGHTRAEAQSDPALPANCRQKEQAGAAGRGKIDADLSAIGPVAQFY
jgi:hypothetical protein